LQLVLLPMLLALLALAASAWFTYRNARKLVAPLHWMAQEVRRWDPLEPETAALAPDHFPDDAGMEARQLGGALQRMGERMRAFVRRERDFTRDASHELRTPLTVIRVASDLLQSDPDLPERAQRSLARIQRAGRDMESVIDSFLILAREGDIEPQREDFAVRDVVAEEAAKARPLLAGKPVELTVVEDADPQLHASPRVLAVMLGNLLADIEQVGANLLARAGKAGTHLRENEWLMAIKQRTSIPGGVSEFDLPAYHWWLHRDAASRRADLAGWFAPFEPVLAGLAIVLRLLRENARVSRHIAYRGVFQLMLTTTKVAQLLRLTLARDLACVPEISANKYALNIRFIGVAGMNRGNVVDQDVEFELMFCNL